MVFSGKWINISCITVSHRSWCRVWDERIWDTDVIMVLNIYQGCCAIACLSIMCQDMLGDLTVITVVSALME